MIQLPDRLITLIQSLEAGKPLMQAEVNRLASLQALDIARLGREFVVQACARHEEQLEMLKGMVDER